MKITPAGLSALENGDLDNFITASTPGGIERQEAEGQQQFVASETLPTNCPREQLEALGFKFGEPVDDIFTAVQMPEGWSKKPTDHSMWSDLIDDRGRKRGGIFYKAAFYDRNAHMRLDRRYSVTSNYELEHGKQVQAFVTDAATSQQVFKTDIVDVGDREWWKADEDVMSIARNWINENYPDYNNPMAYWD